MTGYSYIALSDLIFVVGIWGDVLQICELNFDSTNNYVNDCLWELTYARAHVCVCACVCVAVGGGVVFCVPNHAVVVIFVEIQGEPKYVNTF